MRADDKNECPVVDMVNTALLYADMGHNIKQIASQIVRKFENEYRFESYDSQTTDDNGNDVVISVPYQWVRGNTTIDNPLLTSESVITHLYNDDRFEMLKGKEIINMYDAGIKVFNDTLINDALCLNPDNAKLFMAWTESREKVISSMFKRNATRYVPYTPKHT
jgi:hypothetical protein